MMLASEHTTRIPTHPVIEYHFNELGALQTKAAKADHYRSGRLDTFVEATYFALHRQAIIDVVLDACAKAGVRFVSLSPNYLITLGGIRAGRHGHCVSHEIARSLGLAENAAFYSTGARRRDDIHARVLLRLGSRSGVYDTATRERIGDAFDYGRLITSVVDRPIPDGEQPDLGDYQVSDSVRDYITLWREIVTDEEAYEQGFLVDYEYSPARRSSNPLEEPDDPEELDFWVRDGFELTRDEEFWLRDKVLRKRW